jgi:hypothetical protein
MGTGISRCSTALWLNKLFGMTTACTVETIKTAPRATLRRVEKDRMNDISFLKHRKRGSHLFEMPPDIQMAN